MADTSYTHPFTVFLMLPEALRSEAPTAAQWVRRVWVEGVPGPDGTQALIDMAREKLAGMLGLGSKAPDELVSLKAEMEPVGLYPTHLLDIHIAQPRCENDGPEF